MTKLVFDRCATVAPRRHEILMPDGSMHAYYFRPNVGTPMPDDHAARLNGNTHFEITDDVPDLPPGEQATQPPTTGGAEQASQPPPPKVRKPRAKKQAATAQADVPDGHDQAAPVATVQRTDEDLAESLRDGDDGDDGEPFFE